MPAIHTTNLRDREATRKAIVAAVGQVLAGDGFRALGVNAVARRAGVDKVLIYRYFGGLPELLAAYGEEGDFWWRAEDLIGPLLPGPAENTAGAWLGLIARRHVEALRARPVTIEIMAWEMSERNDLTAALEAVRERRALELVTLLGQRFALPPSIDAVAVAALLGAALNYLVIRMRSVRWFQGVDFADDQGWERLIAAVESLGNALARG